MAKSLFQSAKADVKKKRVFMISIDLLNKLEQIEVEAEKHGVSFPLNRHIEDAISKLINAADKELQLIDSDLQSDSTETVASLSDDHISDDISFVSNEFES